MNTTTDAVVATVKTGPAIGLIATGTTTGTGSGTERGGGTVTVSVVAVKEIDPRIDRAVETVSGTGTGTENATETPGRTGTDAGNATMTTTATPPTTERNESVVTKVPRSRLYPPRQHLPACPHPRPRLLTAHVAEIALETVTAGLATEPPGVLGILGTILTIHVIVERGSVAVR